MASDGYDVLILGGGNAGCGLTVPTRKAGMTVAMVEERDLGGTCPNRDCTPKKVLVAAGHALHEIEQGPCSSYQREQAEARLGGADRSREGDDRRHPRLACRDPARARRRSL